MSKRLLKIVAIGLIVILLSVSLTGCYGKFQLTKKLYVWNGQVGDKFVNSIVMWIFIILPVYEAAGFLDVVVLNVIEFWTGENPVALGPDESQTQFVTVDNKEYKITATQNRFEIIKLDGENESPVALVFDEKSNAWFVESVESGKIKIAQIDNQHAQLLHLIDPEGQSITVDLKNNSIIE